MSQKYVNTKTLLKDVVFNDATLLQGDSHHLLLWEMC